VDKDIQKIVEKAYLEDQEERALIRKIQAGRKNLFSLIVEKYKQRAFLIALSLVNNRDDAMDMAQDAFVKSFRAIKGFDSNRPFFPWFYQILKNACLSHLKRKGLIKKFSLSTKDPDEGDIELPDHSYDPQSIVDRNETKDKVWEAFNKLNLKGREIIMMRHFQDMSYEEIAQALNIPIGTVMSRLFHARKKMKELIENYL
jgi:RNA polymerase sigma-70 factor (ECF subfamily)